MYVLKNTENEKYVSVDYSSGGYPFETEINNATIFTKLEEVKRYNKIFLKYKLFKITITEEEANENR